MKRVPWLQVVLIAALTGVAAAAFTSSFRAVDLVAPLAAAVLLPALLVALAGALGARVAGPVRLLVVVVGAVACGLVVATGGTAGAVDTLRTGLVDGWAQILSTRVPVPATPARMMVPVLLTWLASGTATAAVVASRARLAVMAPVALLWGVAAVLGDGRGAPLVAVVLFVALASALLATRSRQLGDPDTGAGVHLSVAGSSRSWIGVALASAVVVAAVSAAGGLVSPVRDRAYSARESYEIPADHRPQLNPLTELASDIDDDSVVFHATLDAVPTVLGHLRFRGLVLDDFENGTWRATRGFDVTGSELPPDPTESAGPVVVHQRIEPGPGLDGLVPTVGRASTATPSGDQILSVEPLSGALMVQPGSGAERGTVEVTSSSGRVDADGLGSKGLAVSDEARAATGTPGLPDDLGVLLDKVTGGAATPFDQVARLVALFRSADGPIREISPAFTVDPDRPVGFSLAEIDRFLTPEGHVGAPMQYVVAFATMARARGLPTRIVVGWEPTELPEPGRRFAVTAAERTAWVEIAFADVGWVPFDPLPDSADDPPTPEEEVLDATVDQTVAASIDDPPVAPPANPNGTRRRGGRTDEAALWPWMAGAAALLAGVGLGAPIVRKRRRARRRRRADDPVASIVGAWDEAVDRLVEDGFRDRWVTSATDLAEVARARHGDEVGDRFAELGGLVNYALHGPDGALGSLREPAWELSDAVVAAIRRDRGRKARIVAATSRRPLAGPRVGRDGPAGPSMSAAGARPDPEADIDLREPAGVGS